MAAGVSGVQIENEASDMVLSDIARRHLEMLDNVWTPLQDLSLAKPHSTKALVAAVVQHPLTHQRRIVFVPSHLSGDLPSGGV